MQTACKCFSRFYRRLKYDCAITVLVLLAGLSRFQPNWARRDYAAFVVSVFASFLSVSTTVQASSGIDLLNEQKVVVIQAKAFLSSAAPATNNAKQASSRLSLYANVEEAVDQKDQAQILRVAPNIIGHPIEEFSLEAVINNRFEPIPYQIDETDEHGNVFIPGGNFSITGTEGVLDRNDEILFRLADAGEQWVPGSKVRAGGEIVGEIAVTDYKQQKRYVYLIKGSRLRSYDTYVRYSKDRGLLETDFYSIKVNEDNALIWDDFRYVTFKQGKESPFDTMKLRLRTGIIAKKVKAKFNNRHFIAKAVAEKSGPIRAVSEFKLALKVFKIPVLGGRIQAQYFPNSFEYHVYTKIPTLRRSLLRDPRISITFDGNQLEGAKIFVIDQDPALKSVVDGVVTEDEAKMMLSGKSSPMRWFALMDGKQFGWHAALRFNSPETSAPLSLFIEDDFDKADEPERFRGQAPNVGFLLEDLPHEGKMQFVITITLSDGQVTLPPFPWAKAVNTPLDISARPF